MYTESEWPEYQDINSNVLIPRFSRILETIPGGRMKERKKGSANLETGLGKLGCRLGKCFMCLKREKGLAGV